MSVGDLAAALDRVIARRPVSALREAAARLDDACATLATIAYGSTDADLRGAVAGLAHARDELVRVERSCEHMAELLRSYLAGLGADTASATVGPREPAPPRPAPPRQPRSAPDPALIAEVQRQGHKISPERVVRIARTRDHRVVWLEEGKEKSGLKHILLPRACG